MWTCDVYALEKTHLIRDIRSRDVQMMPEKSDFVLVTITNNGKDGRVYARSVAIYSAWTESLAEGKVVAGMIISRRDAFFSLQFAF
jgi:hypothetical protein